MRTCTVEGCDRRHNAHGLCMMHYSRVLRKGTTEGRGWETTEERFWTKVDKSGQCWEWTANKSSGYGYFYFDGTNAPAHRYSYQLANGPIPASTDIDHGCRNKLCVNPDHLRLASRKQNMENLPEVRSNNTSGFRGVSWHPAARKWRARVQSQGRSYSGGLHETREEAQAAVIALRNQLFTHNILDRQQQQAS